MKRVLLVAYAFPPEPLPGALRPGYLARYLPTFGWRPTVLTHTAQQAPFDADVVRVGGRGGYPTLAQNNRLPRNSFVRSMLRAARDTVAVPDELAPWIVPATAAGLRVMRKERFDAIVTTALPMSAHVVGAALSLLTRTPWIADYRDAWSANPYMPWSRAKRALQRLLERALISRATEVTTVSQPIATHLRELHRKPVNVIENAYDASEWETIPDEAPGNFDLVYTGTMYGGKRSAAALFAAIAALRSEAHPLADAVCVHFYGHNNEHVLTEAAAAGIGDCVRLHGVVPRVDAMRAQRRAAGLLVFLNSDSRTAQERGSKYLEYMGARRRMLVFGPPSSVMRDTVERGRLGWFAGEAEGAKSALVALYQCYMAGNYEFTADGAFVPSAAELAQAFAASLNRAAGYAEASDVSARRAVTS